MIIDACNAFEKQLIILCYKHKRVLSSRSENRLTVIENNLSENR